MSLVKANNVVLLKTEWVFIKNRNIYRMLFFGFLFVILNGLV